MVNVLCLKARIVEDTENTVSNKTKIYSVLLWEL